MKRKNLCQLVFRIRRNELELTQQKMGERLHVSQSAVSLYESGKRKVPADLLEHIDQL